MTVPWDTAAADGKRVHTIQKAALFGPVFSLPPATSPPSVCVCVCGSSRKPAALQNSSPSNSHYPSALHREFANIRASAQEAAHAPELSFLSTLCCAKGLQVEVKAHLASKFPIAFCGDCFETASLFPILPLPLSSSLIFFFKMLGTVGLENSMLENHGRRPRWYILKSILGHLWASFHSVC